MGSSNSLISSNHATPSQANDELLQFPNNGITVSFLVNDFIKLCGGEKKLMGLTTSDVSEKFIKPMTKSNRISYCDLLKKKPSSKTTVGDATVFISHAWKYLFLDVVEALEYHFRSATETIIWFDLFSNNQHKAPILEFEWWSHTFKSAIKDIGYTVMVLAPWNDPIPYTRAWCIYEVFCTADTKSKFEIAMSSEHQNQFLKDIKVDPNGSINKMLSVISAEKSVCYKEEDRLRIFKVIKDTVGFHQINAILFEQLRDWVIAITSRHLTETTDETESFLLKYSLGQLYEGQGKYDLAEPLIVECSQISESRYGKDHPDTLTHANNLALHYYNQGKYKKAESLYLKCLEGRKSVLGTKHPDTLTMINNLALLYDDQSKYDKAEVLYIECLEGRTAQSGPDHPDTFISMSNLAGLYMNQRRYEKAEALYVECLEKRKAVLGQNHPSTLTSMNNLALLYDTIGQDTKAESLYIDCLERRRSVLGEDHPHTIVSMSNLGVCYFNQQKYDEAMPLYVKSLEKRKLLLGENHPDTLMAINNLASLYYQQRKFDKAENLYIRCYHGRRAVLGPDHANTLKSMHNLAQLYKSEEKYEKAEALFLDCVQRRKSVLGEKHPDTLSSINSLHEVQKHITAIK